VEEFRSASNLREDEEHEPSEAAMAELAANQQVHYIVAAEKRDSFDSLLMKHIRLNGAYWSFTTLNLLHKLHAVDAAEVVDWIMSC